jgi:coenzyme PQQ precursor peptide PqqA
MNTKGTSMNQQPETWIRPDFEEVSVSMEATAYSDTVEDDVQK